MNINKLKSFDVETYDIDELVGIRSELKTLAANYDDLGLTIPDWVVDNLAKVEDEIKRVTRAEQIALLKKYEAEEAALMTKDEKRAIVRDKITKLRDQLK